MHVYRVDDPVDDEVYVVITFIILHLEFVRRRNALLCRGIGRGGLKGLDEPSFQTRKIGSYLSSFNTKNLLIP